MTYIHCIFIKFIKIFINYKKMLRPLAIHKSKTTPPHNWSLLYSKTMNVSSNSQSDSWSYPWSCPVLFHIQSITKFFCVTCKV